MLWQSYSAIITAFVVLSMLASPADLQADQVVVGDDNYPGATITTFRDGRLKFLVDHNKARTAWVSDVDRIIVVGRGGPFADFNQAEQYRSEGEPDRAIERYIRAKRQMDGFWPELISVRLLMAYQEAGRYGRAVQSFIDVVGASDSGPAIVARLLPDRLPGKRSDETTRAIRQLEQVIARSKEGGEKSLLELLYYQSLVALGDERAAQVAQRVAALAFPKEARTPQVYEVVLSAVTDLLTGELEATKLELLDQAIALCPDEVLPSFLLLKGRTLLRAAGTQEELIRAGWAFMRVVAHMRSDPRAAEGLLGAGLVLERMDETRKAIALLEECVAHRRVDASTKEAAQSALDRLRTNDQG